MAAPNVYDIGDLARISATFLNSILVVADPGAVTLKVLTPAGITTTLVYGVDAIVKDSTGLYHFDFNITLSGDHWYKWFGTTPIQSTAEAYFKVRTPRIT